MSKLFTPLQVGQVTLQHRIAMAPMTRFRADASHIPLPFVKEYYEQRASVQGTLLVTEGTFISPRAGGYRHVPGIYNAAQINAWKEITNAVHAKGSFIFCQLWALGRTADAEVLKADGFDLVSSSAVPAPGKEDALIPRPLTDEEIRKYIEDFAAAARNAVEAGFDGVEIHGANGYLVDQFTKEVCNQRTDAWGGSISKRSRFAVEVVQAIVDAVGADRTAIRLSPFNYIQDAHGVNIFDPRPQFSDLVSSLRPLKLAYLHLIESPEDEDTINFLTDIWGKTSPILVAGAMAKFSLLKGNDPKKAKEREAKYAGNEIVTAYGRYFITNPDLPFRVEKGLELTDYDAYRSSFYTAESRDGYTNLAFSKEFERGVLNDTVYDTV